MANQKLSALSAITIPTKDDLIYIVQGGASNKITMGSMREHFNVKDYGAKGDGVTDDTAAIQAAIDAAYAAGGGKVWFPYTSASYYLETPTDHSGHKYWLTLYSNVWLDSDGATEIKINANGYSGFTFINHECSYVGAAWAMSDTPDTNIRITNLKFIVNGTSTIYFMECGNVSDLYILNNYIDFGLPGYGVFADVRGTAHNIHFHGNHYIGEGGIWLRARGADADPLHDISGVWITHNYIDCYKDDSVHICGTSDNSLGNVHDVFVEDNEFVHDSAAAGGPIISVANYDGANTYATQVYSIIVARNIITITGGGACQGISVSPESTVANHVLRDIKVIGNIITGASKGIGFTGNHIDVMDNILRNCGGATVTLSAIYCYVAPGVLATYRVSGNLVGGCTAGASYANIYLAGDVYAIFEVTDNRVLNNTGNGIYVTGGGKVHGNICQANTLIGITISGGSRSIVSKNRCNLNGTSGILINNHTIALVSENICDSNTNYAIWMAGTSDYVRFIGNRSASNGTNGITLAGTNNILRDNDVTITENSGSASKATGGTIAHGLSGTPAFVSVVPTVTGLSNIYVTADATNLTVTFAGGGTNLFYWEARLVTAK